MKVSIVASAAAITLTAGSAFGAYNITQSDTSQATYGTFVDMDEPGMPQGVPLGAPYAHPNGSISFNSGNGYLEANDWDTMAGIAGGAGDGAQLAGGFSVWMLFDSDITEINFQAWADGSPSPPFGGMNIALFNDGAQVGFYSGVAAFGTEIGSWFNVTADGGDAFDEVRAFNGAFNSFTTYVDNVSYNAPLPAPGALALLGIAGLVGRRRRNG
ncbi:MAG: hypothetical protein ACYTGP_05405 [Planctomycetota bacterium]|jgi:MYXO-CTERM domain-containing protein